MAGACSRSFPQTDGAYDVLTDAKPDEVSSIPLPAYYGWGMCAAQSASYYRPNVRQDGKGENLLTIPWMTNFQTAEGAGVLPRCRYPPSNRQLLFQRGFWEKPLFHSGCTHC